MAGPWEKYRAAAAAPAPSARPAPTTPAQGPWQKYAKADAPAETGPDFSIADRTLEARPELAAALEDKAANQDQRGSLADSVAQGFTIGFNDELSGVLGGIVGLAKGRSFGEGYGEGERIAREHLAAERRRHPVASTLAELAGTIPTLVAPGGAVAKGASLAAKVGRGALAGAGYGATYGAGATDGDLVDRAKGAAFGGAAGAITGGAIPIVTAGAKFVAKPIISAVRARTNPAGYAAEKVAERMGNQGQSVDQSAMRIDRAARSGQAMNLADVGGDSVRDLARTATNIPGPARNQITAKVNIAQLTQGDRLKTAIRTMFADPDAYAATKDGIIAARSTAAKPLYDAAYKKPVPFTFDLENVLTTPAGKAGLAAAKANSLNRREPWAQWFASVDDAGNIIRRERVPDMRALDEVKRVLDRMVEDAKAPADGSPFAKARATPKSIAIQSVRDDLVKFLDKENPLYARARKAALDNIQADEALEFGRSLHTSDPRVIMRKMAAFNEGQRELVRIGAAEALREQVDKAGYTHNAVLRIFNSRDRVNGLRAVFANKDDFNRFRGFIFNEARRSKTRAAVTGNSSTARQLLDARDAGELADVAEVGHQAVMWGPVSAGISALQKAIRRIGGLTPKVADEMGKLLMTSDPAKVRSILTQIRAIEAAKITAEQKAAAIRGVLTRFTAAQEGRQLAPRPTAQLAAQ